MLANMKRLLPLLLAILLLIMAPSAAAQDILIDEIEPTVDPSAPVEYSTMTATSGSFTYEALTYSATPYYPLTQDILCDYSGVLFQKFTVDKGDTVKAGDIVAYLYRPCSQADLARKKLNLQRAEKDLQDGIAQRQADIAALQAQLKEVTDSFEKEILQLTIEYEKTALDQYRYQQGRSIDSLKESIAYYDPIPVRAPQAGTITNLSREKEGEPVREGRRLMSVENQAVLLLKMKSNSAAFVYNLPLTLTTKVNGAEGEEPTIHTLTARIVAAENLIPKFLSVADRGVYLQLEPGQVLPDAVAFSVSGVLKQLDDVITLPETAVIRNGYSNTGYVQVLLPDGSIEKRYVHLGTSDAFYEYARKSGQLWYYWIADGLSEGETVLVQG